MGRCLFEAGDQINVLCINKFGQKQVYFKWRVRTRWLGEQMYGGCLFEGGDQTDARCRTIFQYKSVCKGEVIICK
jgi:hypothetical protein